MKNNKFRRIGLSISKKLINVLSNTKELKYGVDYKMNCYMEVETHSEKAKKIEKSFNKQIDITDIDKYVNSYLYYMVRKRNRYTDLDIRISNKIEAIKWKIKYSIVNMCFLVMKI